MDKEALLKAIDKLPPKERWAVRLRFGLVDGIYRTYDEVGKEVGVSRERIRQIIAKGQRRLKHWRKMAYFSDAIYKGFGYFEKEQIKAFEYKTANTGG